MDRESTVFLSMKFWTLVTEYGGLLCILAYKGPLVQCVAVAGTTLVGSACCVGQLEGEEPSQAPHQPHRNHIKYQGAHQRPHRLQNHHINPLCDLQITRQPPHHPHWYHIKHHITFTSTTSTSGSALQVPHQPHKHHINHHIKSWDKIEDAKLVWQKV